MAKNSNHYALLSVFDKTGITDFARNLNELGYKIISTGGTAKTLTEKRIPIVPIQEITGNPESFDGRMKTISFQIESGILFDRSNTSHVKQATELNVPKIDIVVCNLYPFEKTLQNPKKTQQDIIDNIDVGGPTMVRAAAKNFAHVLVVVDPNDYESVLQFYHSEAASDAAKNLKRNQILRYAQDDKSLKFRRELAAKAFGHLSFYDAQIAAYLNKKQFPNEVTIPGRKIIDLRYGENPYQQAAVYTSPNANSPFAKLKKVSGRNLSLTNLTDINAGIESVKLFPKQPAAVIIKHNCPCGIALGETPTQALKRAIEADPESAFGGVIVLNKKLDLPTAKVIASFKDERKSNIDIIAAVSVDKKALDFLQKVRKTMGIYEIGNFLHKTDTMQAKWITGGFILQTKDNNIVKSFQNWKVVTKKKPTPKQLEQMKLAWLFISRIKSNAVIVVDALLPMTRGIGTGQTSRVRSTNIALSQAGTYAKGGVLASDSFFPFDDSVQLSAKSGITAIVQQGGSINDKVSIDAADKNGIAMVFTNRRAFWH